MPPTAKVRLRLTRTPVICIWYAWDRFARGPQGPTVRVSVPEPVRVSPARSAAMRTSAPSVQGSVVPGTTQAVSRCWSETFPVQFPRLATTATPKASPVRMRSEEHTSELQSLAYLVCRLLLEKKKKADKESTHDSNTSPLAS